MPRQTRKAADRKHSKTHVKKAPDKKAPVQSLGFGARLKAFRPKWPGAAERLQPLFAAIEAIADPQRAFLVIGALLGLTFVAITPPFMVPDENVHLARAIQVSQLGLKAENIGGYIGGRLPVGVGDLVHREFEEIQPVGRVKTSWARLRSGFVYGFGGDRLPEFFGYSVLYSPVAYVPQALAFALARLLHSPILAGFYLGRLANLACYLALVALAIRRAPAVAPALAVVGLLPMALSEAASISCDPLIMGCAFVVVVLGLASRGTYDRTTLILRLVCGIILVAGKPVYSPLLFLGLADLLLRRLWNRRALVVELVMIVAPSAVAVAWLAAIATQALALRHNFPFPTIDPEAQLALIRAHPFRFLTALWHTRSYLDVSYAHMFVGVLGPLTIALPGKWTYAFAYAVVIVSLFVSGRANRVNPVLRGIALLAVLIMIVGMHLGFYLEWTPVGSQLIEGFQGRYLIPMAPAVVVALAPSFTLGRRFSAALRLFCFLGSTILAAIGIYATWRQLWS